MEDQKDLHRRILVNLGVALAGILLLIFVVPPLVRFLMPLIVACQSDHSLSGEADQDHAEAWFGSGDHSGACSLDRCILRTRGAGGVAV